MNLLVKLYHIKCIMRGLYKEALNPQYRAKLICDLAYTHITEYSNMTLLGLKPEAEGQKTTPILYMGLQRQHRMS